MTFRAGRFRLWNCRPMKRSLICARRISPVRLQEGINLVTFDGLPLGWIKRIGARSNNMYPKELRIVNL